MPNNILLILAVSLILTEIFEILYAFIYGLRQRGEFFLLILINVITNPCAVILAYLGGNSLVITLLIEILVVIIEGGLYSLYSETVKKPYTFALCINALSYFTGVIINFIGEVL